jgi:hypothetical protein
LHETLVFVVFQHVGQPSQFCPKVAPVFLNWAVPASRIA